MQCPQTRAGFGASRNSDPFLASFCAFRLSNSIQRIMMLELPPIDAAPEEPRDGSLVVCPSDDRGPDEGITERTDPLSNHHHPEDGDDDLIIAADRYVACPVARVDLEEELFENNDDDDIEANKNCNSGDARTTGPEDADDDECRICLETPTDPLRLGCGHEFCRVCVSRHCANQRVLPVACPERTCRYTLPVRLLHLILGDGLLDLVKRYRARHDRGFKCCPFCHELLAVPPAARDLRCGGCERTFCRVHDTEHLNALCQDHLSTVDALGSFSKPCSHCGTRLQKSAGCDHVVCQYCNGDFCWRCGTHEHLSGTVRKRCRGCGFNLLDYRYERVHRRRLLLWMPVVLPLSLVYVALLAALCALSCCFCGCFCGGRGVSEPPRANLRIGALASLTVIFFPFIALLSDFGFQFAYLAEVFPEQQHGEIPFLTPHSNNDNNDDKV